MKSEPGLVFVHQECNLLFAQGYLIRVVSVDDFIRMVSTGAF